MFSFVDFGRGAGPACGGLLPLVAAVLSNSCQYLHRHPGFGWVPPL